LVGLILYAYTFFSVLSCVVLSFWILNVKLKTKQLKTGKG